MKLQPKENILPICKDYLVKLIKLDLTYFEVYRIK